jgi:hypothetical protein
MLLFVLIRAQTWAVMAGMRSQKMDASPPSRWQGLPGLVGGNQACAVCRFFIRGPRGNVMIQHLIPAVVRISVR